MSPFLTQVLAAVNSGDEGTPEALRERHGKTKTVTAWTKALRLLKTRYLIHSYPWHPYPGLNACVDVYKKKANS